VPQWFLKAAAGQRDENKFMIKAYHPHGRDRLPGASDDIGIDPAYQISVGKVVGPLSDKRTPGGGKLNNLLRQYGWSPTLENMDADHVQEIQFGGPDSLRNLWPLDASINRGAGSTLAQTQVTFKGKPITISELKGRRRKFWFRIIKTEP
jgi:hypothetical protein